MKRSEEKRVKGRLCTGTDTFSSSLAEESKDSITVAERRLFKGVSKRVLLVLWKVRLISACLLRDL